MLGATVFTKFVFKKAVSKIFVFRKAVFIKAALTALIVGSVLLVINQYGALFGEDELRLIPAVLTYCVPFSVFIIGKISK